MKTKLTGCRQRIKYCRSRLDALGYMAYYAPSKEARKCSWRGILRELTLLNRLLQELEQLKTGGKLCGNTTKKL